MSLFSFADIKISDKIRSLASPNSVSEELGQYGYDLYRYPIDVGNTDKGHYMVIYINTQRQSEYTFRAANDQPTVIQNRSSGISQSAQSIISDSLNSVGNAVNNAVGDFLNFGSSVNSFVSGLGSNLNEISLSGTRTIQRTTDAIALYMPDTLTFTNNQQYSDLSLSGDLAALAAGAKSVADDGLTTQALSPFIAAALQKDDVTRSLFTSVTGKVVNPLLDMIYTSPQFREFRFEFMFYPRSSAEALQVQQIIQKLQFHQAPEIDNEVSGFFMVPPSEFDIKFYYNGAENPNIPKMTTCVLTSIDVDYAPNGFSAYELPNEPKPSLGKTGMPVATRLSLQFKETEILTKKNFKDALTGRSLSPFDFSSIFKF